MYSELKQIAQQSEECDMTQNKCSYSLLFPSANGEGNGLENTSLGKINLLSLSKRILRFSDILSGTF